MHLLCCVCLMLLSCCYNVFVLQMILEDAPGSPNLVSFMQVLFIAVEGFVFTTRFMTVRTLVPLMNYIKLSVTNFVVISCQSILMYMQVDISLLHLSRACTLMGTLLLGTFVYEKKYRTSKYISVALITIGISTVFVASADSLHRMRGSDGQYHSVKSDSFKTITAIGLLLLAIYASAMQGMQQEILFNQYKNCEMEALFFCHALLLPIYLIMTGDIQEQINTFNKSNPIPILRSNIFVPKLWLLLASNVITQFICSQTIYQASSEYTSLTISLMVTLRKFASLVISLIHFDNNFTFNHWIGTIFIFSGTILFTDKVFDTITSLFRLRT